MTTADELGRALDVIAGDPKRALQMAFFSPSGERHVRISWDIGWDGEFWTNVEDAFNSSNKCEVQAAFIGIAVPWLRKRGWSLDTHHDGEPVWCHRSVDAQDGPTDFDATLDAVLAEGARDE